MKKIALIFALLLIGSCSVDEPNYRNHLLPIKSSETPQSFRFGEIDTIKITYKLPSRCYDFNGLYYQYEDTTRIVAVRAIEQLEARCTNDSIEKEYKFPISVGQKKTYVFKFWKGKDAAGKNIFEEKIVPVN